MKQIMGDTEKKKTAVQCSRCINIALSGSSVNRRSSSLRRATVCKAKPLCFCRPFRGWGGLTMLPILSTLLPQMTVSVASRLVAESRDWPHTQTQTPAPDPDPDPAQAVKHTQPSAGPAPAPQSALSSAGPLYLSRSIAKTTPFHPTGGDVGVAPTVLVFSWSSSSSSSSSDELINRRAAIRHDNPLTSVLFFSTSFKLWLSAFLSRGKISFYISLKEYLWVCQQKKQFRQKSWYYVGPKIFLIMLPHNSSYYLYIVL